MARHKKSTNPQMSIDRYNDGVANASPPKGNPEKLCEGLERAVGVNFDSCMLTMGKNYADSMANPVTQENWREGTANKGKDWIAGLQKRAMENLPAARR